MAITEIEKLTEDQAKEMAIESMVINEHNIYFVDFDNAFGYSALVFMDGHHIKYANDYQLHHSYMMNEENGREKLRQWYIDTLNHKLYTEEQLLAPIEDYDDYKNRDYFLRNLYPLRVDYISAFYIDTPSKAKETEERKKKIEKMHYNPISFSYMDDKDFIQHMVDLHVALQGKLKEMEDNYDYWVSAFKKEMYNHEYSIAFDPDWDVLRAFGNVPENGTLNEMMDYLKFNDTKKNAYREAVRQYWSEQKEVW